MTERDTQSPAAPSLDVILLEARETYARAGLPDPITEGDADDLDAGRAEWDDIIAAVRADEREKVLPLIRDLTDPEECRFDHRGGCQVHGYLTLKPGELYPHEAAKQWIKTQQKGQTT